MMKYILIAAVLMITAGCYQSDYDYTEDSTDNIEQDANIKIDMSSPSALLASLEEGCPANGITVYDALSRMNKRLVKKVATDLGKTTSRDEALKLLDMAEKTNNIVETQDEANAIAIRLVERSEGIFNGWTVKDVAMLPKVPTTSGY